MKIIGVDADQTQTDPGNAAVYLTSVLKRMDSTVMQVIKQTMDGKSKPGQVAAWSLATNKAAFDAPN